jgi:hypothetical protein
MGWARMYCVFELLGAERLCTATICDQQGEKLIAQPNGLFADFLDDMETGHTTIFVEVVKIGNRVRKNLFHTEGRRMKLKIGVVEIILIESCSFEYIRLRVCSLKCRSEVLILFFLFTYRNYATEAHSV